MRKKITLFIGFSILLQCSDKKEIPKIDSKEQSFIELIHKSENEYNSLPNKIKQEEYFSVYDTKVTQLLLKDSLIISNWTGLLKDLSVDEYDTGNILKFSIVKQLKPQSEYETLTFDCSYIVGKSNLKNDSLYNKISNLRDYSDVYFTGIFVKNINNKIVPNEDSFSLTKSNNYFTSPKYKFYVIDISTQINKKISSNLYQSIKLNRQIFDLLNEKAENRIDDNDWQTKTKELSNQANELEKKLTESEKQINNLTKNYFSSEFI